ncbi:unnamed protein product [Caenorhabditis nigoni]
MSTLFPFFLNYYALVLPVQKDGTREFWEYESFDNFYKYSENFLDALKEFKEFYLKDVDWLRSNASEFPALFVRGLNQRHDFLQYILDNLKYTNSLELDVDGIERLPLGIPDTLEELRIRDGSWITLGHIRSLKMRKLAFWDTYLTNEDLNVFFKSWIEMKSHHNLDRLKINLWKTPGDFITNGLRDIPYRIGPMRPGPSPSYVPAQGSFEVTRDDGLTASICT